MINSPLDQFDIKILFTIFSIPFTNSALSLLIGISLLIFLHSIILKKSKYKVTNWQYFIEFLYTFILNLVSETLYNKKYRFTYFPIIFTIFTILLIANLLGLIPYSFTATSHIILTFSLSLGLFIGLIILTIFIHKLHYFSLFLPPGAPLIMSPLIVMIEIISYLSRPISLSIRLAANMIAGHMLLKILTDFIWVVTFSNLYFLIPIPLIFLLILLGLETAIAALQSYILTILFAIYLNEAYELH